MTGVEFNTEFDRLTDKSYADYYGPQTKNQFFKRALLYTIENVYKGLDSQITYDEISSLIATNRRLTPRSGIMYIKPLVVTNATLVSPTTIQIQTNYQHFLLNGESVNLSLQGFSPSVSGNFTVSVLTPNVFSVTVPATTGSFVSGQVTPLNFVPNYQHYLQSFAYYHKPVQSSIKIITDNQPIKISVTKMTNIRQGDRVKVILNQTLNNANGDFYVKTIGKNTFSLYLDENFTQPAIGNIPYVSDSSDRLVVEKKNVVIPIVSDIKGQSIDPPTVIYPRYEIADNSIKYYPVNVVEVDMDYILISPIQIDRNDNVTNLELYYPYRFLLRVADTAALLFSQEIKDMQMNQMSTQRIVQN